jgi:hypothetical protein
MSYTYCSSSASGSPSPSSETPSNNTSPTNIPTPLRPSKASDETDSQSTHSRETPNRMPLDLPRGGLTGRGGCWTCRLRRKKCDEQREGNSCHTCKRLRIDCLGWGTRRPEWMRVSTVIIFLTTVPHRPSGQESCRRLQGWHQSSANTGWPHPRSAKIVNTASHFRGSIIYISFIIICFSFPTVSRICKFFGVFSSQRFGNTSICGSIGGPKRDVRVWFNIKLTSDHFCPSVHEGWELSAFGPQFPLQRFRLSSLASIARGGNAVSS